MSKEWPCDKCGMILKWKEPYVQGTKPINKQGEMPHDCKGVPEPETLATTSPGTEKPTKLETHPAGKELENKFIQARRALSLEVWAVAVKDAKSLNVITGDQTFELAKTLYLGMMYNL